MSDLEHLNTEGLAQVGEVETRAMKEARVAEDYNNALIAGKVGAFNETASFIRSVLGSLGRFDDPRGLNTVLVWISDKVREAQAPNAAA